MNRISILLTAKNSLVKETQKKEKQVDKLSDKLLQMHKDEANTSIRQRAKLRAQLSQVQGSKNTLSEAINEIDKWILEIKRGDRV
ncbi:hypothetical protein [Lysinibacillus sp. RC79]|uniref:hypothetical protein n=1 Tax=Lysinibacillus sp. RC79 TaxID=3156296 RepID=UPI003513F457